MKTISEEISLSGRLETVTLTELRKTPGEVFASVALGKTFVVTLRGDPIAVISKPPGTQLSISIDKHGKERFIL